jgi:hypothetical protein
VVRREGGREGGRKEEISTATSRNQDVHIDSVKM